MDIRILGDLTIDGGPLSPKERSLLAALVLRSGSVMTASQLADAVWGDELPSTWPKQVQAAIVRIRRSIGRTAVITTRDGYRLAVEPEAIDAVRFERLVEQARMLRATDPRRAVNALEQALALWTGEPYADLGAWEPARLEAERIVGVRDAAEEELLEARLDCGEHRSVVPAAERLVRAAPLRERRWAILATALYRSGRQADALAALRSARERFAEELGIEPGAALRDLESVILRQDPSLDAPPVPPETSTMCPYRGLQPFGVDDAATFFGRDEDIRAAIARLDRSPFLAISGASGSGKSSLVLAGVVPALRRRGEVVTILGAGRAALTALRASLARPEGEVVVIDQFEEIFHERLPEDEVAEFGALLAAAVASHHRVIVVVRSDYLDACILEPSIGPMMTEGVHLIGPLSPDGLRRAIEAPAHLAGLHLEPGLVELILRDAAGAPGVLPHVSHALVETWLRREGATLTVAGYLESGGISGAIAQSADQLFRSLDPADQEICRSTFLRLVEIGADGAPMRRRISLKPLRDDPAHDRLLTRLAEVRLVSAEEDSLVVAHESLALAWPRLRGWLDDDADGWRTMHALANAATTWEADARPAEDLYRGARLHAAVEWTNNAHPELTEVEREFLDASTRQEQNEFDEIALRAKHDRRQNRRLRVLLAAAVALFAVAVTASGIVAASSNETARQRTTAQIEALTSTSLSVRGTERDVAALLAVEAFRRWPDDPRSRSALMGVMTRSHGLLETTYIDDVTDMAGVVIPGTRRAVVATAVGVVATYDIDSGARVGPLNVPTETNTLDSRWGPAVSGDGSRVAFADGGYDPNGARLDHRLWVADLDTGALVLSRMVLDFPLSSITMNHEGDTVAAIDEMGSVRLIDVGTGLTRTVTGTSTHEAQWNTNRAGVVRFTPQGRLLYGTFEGPLQVIDPGSASVAATVSMPEESTNVAMTVLSESRAITVGDRHISAVDLATLGLEWSQEFTTRNDESCAWVSASVTLDTVYCGDLFGHIIERSLSTGAPTDRSFDPQLGTVGPLVVLDDGRELVAVDRGRAITRWRLDGSGAIARVLAPGWSVVDRYSPTGSSIVVARRTDDVESWEDYREFAVLDTRTEELTVRLPVPSFGVKWAGADTLVGDFGGVGPSRTGFLDVRTGESLAGDPLPEESIGAWMNEPGDRAYIARDGGEIWTFDPRTGRRVEPTLQTNGGEPTFLSTSPDGSRVLVTSWNSRYIPDSMVFDAETGAHGEVGLLRIGRTALSAGGEIIGASREEVVRYDGETLERIGALPGISGGIETVNASPDGRTYSVFSLDEAVSVYDLVAGIRLGDPIAVSSEGAISGVFRADGAELAVNVPAGIAVWDLRPSAHSAAACAMAGRDLTRDEWASYLAELGPYRSTCGFGED